MSVKQNRGRCKMGTSSTHVVEARPCRNFNRQASVIVSCWDANKLGDESLDCGPIKPRFWVSVRELVSAELGVQLVQLLLKPVHNVLLSRLLPQEHHLA